MAKRQAEKKEQAPEQAPEQQEASGMVSVTLSREFKHWDGQQVNVYPPGEAEMSEECARLARQSGAVVLEEEPGKESGKG